MEKPQATADAANAVILVMQPETNCEAPPDPAPPQVSESQIPRRPPGVCTIIWRTKPLRYSFLATFVLMAVSVALGLAIGAIVFQSDFAASCCAFSNIMNAQATAVVVHGCA